MSEKNEIIETANEVIETDSLKDKLVSDVAEYTAKYIYELFVGLAEDFSPIVMREVKKLLLKLLDNNKE